MAEKKRKKNYSPETLQKLSDLAKQRHAEGKFGGSEFGKLGGRPRKDRASKRVAEAAQADENARKIIEVFKDAVDSAQPMGIRLKGAELWLGIENSEGKLQLQEEVADSKQHSREELISILAEKLTNGQTSQILRRQLESEAGIVDADVVDDEEEADVAANS